MAFSNPNSVSQQLAEMARKIPQRELSPGEVREELPAKEEEEEWAPNLNNHMVCPDCQIFPPNLIEEFSAGDLVCGDCGRVLGERIIDTRSEWRTFQNDDDNKDPTRVGEAAGVQGEQLRTTIAYNSTEASKELGRAQLVVTVSTQQRKEQKQLSEIRDLCGAAKLTSTVTSFAEELLHRTQKGCMKFQPQAAVQGACIFIACRKEKVGRTFPEIATLCGVSTPRLAKAFKAVELFMKQDTKSKATTMSRGVVATQEQYEATKAVNASELMDRFGSNLGLEYRIIAKAKLCAAALNEHGGIYGCNPRTVAGCALYVISHLMKDAKSTLEIAKVVEVRKDTIRKAYRTAHPHHQKWLNNLVDVADLHLLPNVDGTNSSEGRKVENFKVDKSKAEDVKAKGLKTTQCKAMGVAPKIERTDSKMGTPAQGIIVTEEVKGENMTVQTRAPKVGKAEPEVIVID